MRGVKLVVSDAHEGILSNPHAHNRAFAIARPGFTAELAQQGEHPCEEVDQLVTRHLELTERKIEALMRLRRELRRTLASCKGRPCF